MKCYYKDTCAILWNINIDRIYNLIFNRITKLCQSIVYNKEGLSIVMLYQILDLFEKHRAQMLVINKA